MNYGFLRTRLGFPFDGVIGRAILLVPFAMALWWFLFKGASLWVLRYVAWLPLAFLIAPGGLNPVKVNPDTREWVFNVAVNTDVMNARTGERQHIESMEFAAAEDNVAFFACGWFSYLALALSAGAFSRNQTRRVLKGLALETSINVLSLAAYAYINGYGSVINTPNSHDPVVWLYKYAYHIVYLVVPFAGPVMVALLVHPEWKEYFSVPDRAPQRQSGTAKARAL